MTAPKFSPPTGTNHVYDYTWADSSPAFKVCRRDAAPGVKKTFRQFSLKDGEWVAKQMIPHGQQPLYRLPEIVADPAAAVLLVEGEKAVAGAAQYLPAGWLATTWAGGSGNIRGADLTPLEGRTVVIWPDNDEAGRTAAEALVARMPHASIVTVPVVFPEKWDLADPLPEGFDAAWVQAKIIHNTDNNPPPEASKNLPSYLNGHDHGTTPAVQQKPILLVDSDTTAVIAMQYLPPGWACAIHDGTVNSSLGPLAQATHAVIWGRNDEGGRTWAESVADSLAIPSHVVTLARLPQHWHLGDALPAGRTSKQLTSYLAAAIARCVQRQRTTMATPAAPTPPAPRPAPPPVVQQPPAPPTGPITALPFIRAGARNDGAIKPLMKNAAMLLEANPHIWDLRFNEFSYRAFLGSEPISDGDILRISEWVQGNGVHASVGVISEAINAVAAKNTFHPVKDYLSPLTWDGIPRLEMIFIDHAGSPDTALNRAMTVRWFIQAVARIMEPGCQADATLILEGVQGLRKSSMFRAVFGDQWFTDHLPDLTSKDALIQLRGVWCIEISELATLGRADVKKINQFLTSRVDRYRDPYGRVVADFPRTCVFAGTVNPGAGGYLKDETGARRFWPIEISDTINVPALSANRDQLWAEAVHRYRAGEPWYLHTEALTDAAQIVVTDRFVSDPWQEKIDEFLRGRASATLAEIFRIALLIPDIGKWTPLDMGRIYRCLSFAGWTRERAGNGFIYVPGPEAVQGSLVPAGRHRPDVESDDRDAEI